MATRIIEPIKTGYEQRTDDMTPLNITLFIIVIGVAISNSRQGKDPYRPMVLEITAVQVTFCLGNFNTTYMLVKVCSAAQLARTWHRHFFLLLMVGSPSGHLVPD